jgi:ATPase subunit of ABC transporter with duplicated ATPase domains
MNNSNNIFDTSQSSNVNDNDLATFTTSAPCQYHRGSALTIYGLSLEHHGGRALFQTAYCTLPHGNITGITGTNGAGKSSFAQVISSKLLEGFPVNDLTVEYLAAADDGEGHHEPFSSLDQLPREYIKSRPSSRIGQLRKKIQTIEQAMEKAIPEDLERISEELSDHYVVEESMKECIQRETDIALEKVGFNCHSRKPLEQLSCVWRYKGRLIAAILTHPDC